jgi:hypothetical protein
VLLLILAITSVVLHIQQWTARNKLNLPHEPGTIAAVVSLTAGTAFAGVLQEPSDSFEETLAGRTFKLNPDGSKIDFDSRKEV